MPELNIVTEQPPEQVAKADVRAAAAQYNAILTDLTTNWDSLDQAGKAAALRAACVFLLKVAKWLVLRHLPDLELT